MTTKQWSETREWWNVCGDYWSTVGFRTLEDAQEAFRESRTATHIERFRTITHTTVTQEPTPTETVADARA
jgi:hypothetical protein